MNLIKNKTFVKAVLITHRYLGLTLSFIFLIWCLSGFVMMYKEFPHIKEREKINNLTPINFKSISINPNQAWKFLPDNFKWKQLKLYSLIDKPVYKFVNENDSIILINADVGGITANIGEKEAKNIVSNYTKRQYQIVKTEIITELDQWIPKSKYLPYLPIYKVHINDKSETIFYISSKSGDIIQKLNFSEKVWAWLGPIPHWLYFKNLRINTDAWRGVVIVISFIGVLMCVGGIVLGTIRTLDAKKRSKKLSPYKKRWFKWHHYLGFIFGLFILTWVLSGLFSMNPLKWSSEDFLDEDELVSWKGNTNEPPSVITNFNKLQKFGEVKEIELNKINNNYYWLAKYNDNQTKILFLEGLDSLPKKRLTLNELMPSIKKLKVKDTITEITLLTDYDNYYYNKDRNLPLPVYIIKFSDKLKTWYYINPTSATVVRKKQKDSRFERWIYNGLHSMDFAFIFYKRPLWDIVVLVLLMGCTMLSFTGLKLTINSINKWYKR